MNKYELKKRIKKLIEDSDVPISHVDHLSIADQLQLHYRDYSRKTKSSFRKSVFEAIQNITSEISHSWLYATSERDNSINKRNSNGLSSLNDLLLKRYKQDIPNQERSENGDFFIDRDGTEADNETEGGIKNDIELNIGMNIDAQKKRKDNEEFEAHNYQQDSAKFSNKKQKTKDNIQSKTNSKDFPVIFPSHVSFSDLEGIEDVVKELEENFINWVQEKCYLLTPRGLMLHGPAGCGKSTFTIALASTLNLPLISLSAEQLLPNMSFESDEKLKNLLEQAISIQPCIISIKNIELIAGKKEDVHGNATDNKFLNQFIEFLLGLSSRKASVWIIGITGKIELVNPLLLTPGKLDEEIILPMPSQTIRIKILQKFCKLFEAFFKEQKETAIAEDSNANAQINSPLKDDKLQDIYEMVEPQAEVLVDVDLDFEELSQCTPAFSGADLKKLVIKAFRHAILRQKSSTIKTVMLVDFMSVLKKMHPTAKKEDYVTIPDVSWSDVGALSNIREELKISILIPVRQPDLMKRLGLNQPSGVLLFGPPGCGKTMIAKAVANEASINFISVKGPELLNMYVGESERNIRTLFRRAQDCSPCIIFFDEIDSICEKRSTSSEKGNNVKVVQQLLAELDGLQERRHLYIMGATNRLDRVDPAFLRENRFNRILYVGLPQPAEKLEILHAITKNGKSPLLDEGVDLKEVAEDVRCNKFTGADLTSLVRTAARFLLKDLLTTSNNQSNAPLLSANYKPESIDAAKETTDSSLASTDGLIDSEMQVPGITKNHFELALQKVKPSIRQKDLEYYEKIAAEYELDK